MRKSVDIVNATRKRKKTAPQLVGQTIARWFFRMLFILVYRIRVHRLGNYPDNDGMLICSNHQSFLDPLVLGVVCPRPVNYLARQSIFKFSPLGWFLEWNDTIALDLEGSGIRGMKTTLGRLKRGETVIMFPEGTRSSDGEFHQLMHGFCTLAKRAKTTLMPIGIDGAFQAYSRHQKIPQFGTIHAVMGKPIPFEEYGSLTNQQISDLLQGRIRDCFEQARERRQRLV